MLDNILSFLPWIGASGALVGVGAFFLGVPAILGIINSILQIATPILKGISELGIWYIEEMWDGLKTMFSNASTFVVVATIAAISGFAGSNLATKQIVHVECQPGTSKPTLTLEDWNPFRAR